MLLPMSRFPFTGGRFVAPRGSSGLLCGEDEGAACKGSICRSPLPSPKVLPRRGPENFQDYALKAWVPEGNLAVFFWGVFLRSGRPDLKNAPPKIRPDRLSVTQKAWIFTQTRPLNRASASHPYTAKRLQLDFLN